MSLMGVLAGPLQSTVAPSGAAGPAGADGADGAAGSVWRDGSGAPSNGLGANGDYYLNTANGDVYLRAAGTYSVVANIKGANGTNGTNGTNGAAGADGLTASQPRIFGMARIF